MTDADSNFASRCAPAREGLTLGVDLGAAGAVSLLDADGHLIAVADLPCLDDGPRSRPTVSASGFAAIVREWQPDRAVVEFVSSRPTDSPMSAFAFGMARATVMATLEVLGVSATFITVPVWKRTVGIGAGRGQNRRPGRKRLADGRSTLKHSPGREMTAARNAPSSAWPAS